jgi:hypothetical protein
MKLKCKLASVIALTFVLILFSQSVAVAQIFGGGSGEKVNTEFVPKTAFASAVVFPQRFSKDPNYKLFPREVVTAWGESELGFDPLLIKQMTWMVKVPEDLSEWEMAPPVWAVVLHFEELQGLNGKLIDKLEQKTLAGKAIFSGAEIGMPSFLIVDELTVISAEDESFIEEMLLSKGTNSLTELMKNNGVSGQTLAFVDLEMARPVFEQIKEKMGADQALPPLSNIMRIPDLLDSFELGIDTDGTVEGKLIMHTANDETAEELETNLAEVLKLVKSMLVAEATKRVDRSDPVGIATIQYSNRIADKYEARLTPKRTGSDLTIEAKEELLAIPYLFTLMGSMDTAQFNPRQKKMNDLRQVALAVLNYESAFQKFPSRTIIDEEGRPLFSGRVSILPFMEQNNLHGNLRLDEPWDSPHNSQFTKDTKVQTFGENEMVRFPVFPNSMWDEENPVEHFQEITDGTSNTILAIYASEEDVVSWADPSPWILSVDDPMTSVFGERDEVQVVFVDGSVQILKKSEMTNDKLKAMLTVSGGEIVER